ncbi:MAG TPA: alkyl hydroperoxide reductase subunit F, partial [Gammaproteobacteria bacterium]|nr:alkyl hydroperoxide reductase subunit F [Gammaproteobacteria bacterium]
RGQSSVEGIFACGDVTTVPYKQIVIAMGEGSKAGLTAFEYLLTHEVEKDTLAA